MSPTQEILVRTLVAPPAWVVWLTVGLTAVCLAIAVVSVYRNGYGADVAREQGEILVVVLSIVAATKFLTGKVEYAPAVIWGTVIGYGFAQSVMWCVWKAHEDAEGV